MARRAFSVRDLAVEAGIDVDEAILTLLDAGLEIPSPREKIWSRDIKKVRHLLGVQPQPRSGDERKVTNLAHRAGRSETEVRGQLI